MCAPVRFKPSPVESLVPSDTDASYGFVGALGVRWDAGTGLHYMRQRWYDPGLGRFVSRDPVPNMNMYAYSDNNPVRFVDPLGLQTGGPAAAQWQDPFSNERFPQHLAPYHPYLEAFSYSGIVFSTVMTAGLPYLWVRGAIVFARQKANELLARFPNARKQAPDSPEAKALS